MLHVPVAELLDPAIFREERWTFPWAEDRPIFFFELVGDTVWGATGAMLRQLLGLVTGTSARGSARPTSDMPIGSSQRPQEGLQRMFNIWTVIYLVVVGLLAGYAARFLVPGNDEMTWWQTMLLGHRGVFVGFGAYLLFGSGRRRRLPPPSGLGVLDPGQRWSHS